MELIEKDISKGINLTRSTACILVVLLHIAGYGFYENGDNWRISNLIDSFTRVCVPLFIMITGSLLIQKKSVKPIKRINKILYCLLFWSLFYTYVDNIHSQNIFDWFLAITKAPIKYHLWYLYACIGFYITLPILSTFYCNSSLKYSLAYVTIWFSLSTLSIIDKVFSLNFDLLINNYQLSAFINLTGYLLLGKLITRIPTHYNSTKIVVTSLLIFISFSLMTAWITSYWSDYNHKPNALFYSNLSPLVIIASASLFFFLIKVSRNIKDTNILISFIPKHTLGIYCIHIFILEGFIKLFFKNEKMDLSFLSTILIALLIFFVCLFVIFILKKIPILRKAM
ncbi:acyltransferase [Citrobacter europaeus]|uniref:acyltransferase n=1 Tax=Citrobacter europaeus TaxID=1914243 RepID=UPI001A1F9D2E|nr:acyltransferase family protein [Citrobacter freundii]